MAILNFVYIHIHTHVIDNKDVKDRTYFLENINLMHYFKINTSLDACIVEFNLKIIFTPFLIICEKIVTDCNNWYRFVCKKNENLRTFQR